MKKLLEEVAKRCPEGKLPDDYMVIDTETSGDDSWTDRAIQYGMCFAYNRKHMDALSQIIDRRDTYIQPRALAVHGISHARMEKEGVKAEDYLPDLIKLLNWWRSSKLMFVGHNLVCFDARIIERESSIVKCPFSFRENEVIDTGMLVKASQLAMFPTNGESLINFYKRVNGVNVNVRWSLSKYCYSHYELYKYGIKQEDAHDAGTDCLLSHYLWEEIRLSAEKEM